MTGAKCWWTPSWPWRKSWACARWPRAWKPTTKPSGWPGWAATNCRVISFPSLARHKTLKTGGRAGWQALPPALFPDLPPRELEEQILQIRRPVQRAQGAMLPQRLQQRLRVLGVVKHRLTADLHARGQGTQRGVFGHLDGPHAEHLHHIRLQVLGDQLARAAFRNLAAVVQHQQARQRQAPLHAARQLARLGVGLVGEGCELQQLGYTLVHHRALQPKVAAEYAQVLGAGEVRVEGVELRDHTQLRLDGQRIAWHVQRCGAGLGGEMHFAAIR